VDLSTGLLFVAGLALLVAGAEALVRGASRLAEALGIPPLVVGLTVVAFGTSSPELAVGVASAWQGNGDIAFGNVVGSNVFNLLFILGASALVTPLPAARAIVRVEAPLLIVTAVLAGLAGLDGQVSRWEGLLLAAGLAGYLAWQVRAARRGGLPVPAPEPGRSLSEDEARVATQQATTARGARARRLAVDAALVAGGLVALVAGSRWLVAGAVALARSLGVSDLVIAVTVVAAGTSLPEVATSILAAVRKQPDIAVGNVIGSNLFNVLGVLGLSAAVAPGPVGVSPAALALDVPAMIGASVLAWIFLATGRRVNRPEGAVFLAGYVGYVMLVLRQGSGG